MRSPGKQEILQACSCLTIRDLRTALAVAEAGSIRQAGAQLGISQSATTRIIQRLEEALGVSLFERSQTGTRLTIAGWEFADRTRKVIDEFRGAAVSASEAGVGGNGQLRVGLIASLSNGALRDVVDKFIQQHADIRLSFTKADRSELMTLLTHRVIDLVVAAGNPPSVYGDMLLLTEEQLYVAVSRSSPLARRRWVTWHEMQSMPFIVAAGEPGPEIHDYIVRSISGLGCPVSVIEHRIEREGLMNLVGLGLGVSLICEQWRGVRYPNVNFVPVKADGVGEKIPFSLTWRPENDNPALRRFLSLAREVAKAGAATSGPS